MFRNLARAFVLCFLSCAVLTAQKSAPSTGDITVRLSQPLDSANARPNQVVTGSVQSSTNPAVPKGIVAAVLLVSEPSGGFTVHLVRLNFSGQMIRTASTPGVLAGVSKIAGFLHDSNTPKTAPSGARVYLPASTDIRFTLTDAPPQLPTPPTPPARIARTAPPPPAPRHPANTVVDLPPAADGYPPLHATHPAEEGCWWTPYLSTRWALEAPLQTCGKETDIKILDSDKGLALVLNGSVENDFVTIAKKPAAQPIEAAIQEQFIKKLKSPAARLGCKLKKMDAPGPAADYHVEPTGAYAKRKEFQSEDDSGPAVDPCPGLTMNDAVDRFFSYEPDASKTHFLYVQQEDYGSLFDHAAIRYRDEQ